MLTLTQGEKSSIVRAHNRGRPLPMIAEDMGLAPAIIEQFLRTRPGYPGHIACLRAEQMRRAKGLPPREPHANAGPSVPARPRREPRTNHRASAEKQILHRPLPGRGPGTRPPQLADERSPPPAITLPRLTFLERSEPVALFGNPRPQKT